MLQRHFSDVLGRSHDSWDYTPRRTLDTPPRPEIRGADTQKCRCSTEEARGSPMMVAVDAGVGDPPDGHVQCGGGVSLMLGVGHLRMSRPVRDTGVTFR